MAMACFGLVENVTSSGIPASGHRSGVAEPGALGNIEFAIDQDTVTTGADIGQERANLAVIDTTQGSRILPLHSSGLSPLLRKPRRIGDQNPSWIIEMLDRM
jgi:hypothetical protein